MSVPISLRNIPPHALQLAHRLSEQTNLSIADLLRQAVVSGLLIEATKVAPDQDGTLGGLEPAYLAKSLRRHLSSAIDLLIEYGEHPYQGILESEENAQQGKMQAHSHLEEPAPSQQEETQNIIFENAIGDDLEMLGMGVGLAEIAENQDTFSKPSE